LDDECKLPGASDEKFASRLYKIYEKNDRFTATPAHKRDSKFCIKHYAGPVIYTATTFVDKNKDELPKEASSLVLSSSNQFISNLFAATGADAEPAEKAGKATQASVGSQFRQQLHDLMVKIYATAPHYVRCLKPNDENVSDNFHRIRTTEQLRYGGVLEAVRVARSGFPVRLVHADFYVRYRCLANPSSGANRFAKGLDNKALCELLLSDVYGVIDYSSIAGAQRKINDYMHWRGKDVVEQESIQLGITKVFLRKHAHDVLESRRSRRISISARQLQSIFRSYRHKALFLLMKRAVLILQRVTRGMLARIVAREIRELRAVVRIQTCYRAYYQYFLYLRTKSAIVIIQSHIRGKQARMVVQQMRRVKYGSRLARIFHGMMRRYRYLRYRKAVVELQCLYRCKVAKRSLIDLRKAAKDIGKLQQSNEALKAEIEALRAKAAEESKKLAEKLVADLEAKAKEAEATNKAILTDELAALKEELSNERKLRQIAEEKLVCAESKLISTENELLSMKNSVQVPTAAAAPADTRSDMQATVSPVRRMSKDVRSADPKTPITAATASSPAGNIDLEIALKNEILARQKLEEEVARLRHISMDLTAQLDSCKPTTTASRLRRGSAASGLSSTLLDTKNNKFLVNKLNKLDHPKLTKAGTESAEASPESWSNAWDSSQKSPVAKEEVVVSTDDTASPAPVVSTPETNVNPLNNATRQRKMEALMGQSKPGTASAGVDKKALLAKFGRNLDAFKIKFSQGIRCVVWERDVVSKQDMMLKLVSVDNTQRLYFENISKSRFTFSFSTVKDVAPVTLSDIMECISGGEISDINRSDVDSCLTIITKAPADLTTPSRILALKFMSKDEKNSIQTGLRTLMSDVYVSSNASTDVSRDMREEMKDEATALATPDASKPVKRVTTRRASVRDTVLDEMRTPPTTVPIAAAVPDPVGVPASDVTKQLLVERANYEKLMMQMLMLTNDLNDKEDHIIQFRVLTRFLPLLLTHLPLTPLNPRPVRAR
jgi:myosin heavy subunit